MYILRTGLLIAMLMSCLSLSNAAVSRQRQVEASLDRQPYLSGQQERSSTSFAAKLDAVVYALPIGAANKDGVGRSSASPQDTDGMVMLWHSFWFRLTLLIIIPGALLLLYLWRVRTLISQKLALENEINHRTAEVSAQKAELEITNQALIKLNKLQEVQQSELTRFLAVASHDLRQPMHALNLYLGALGQFDLPEEARPVINNLKNCARTMDDMFTNLLDLSRLDAQIVQPQLHAFPIDDILSSLEVEFSPQAQAKGLQFQTVPCQLAVESDPTLIEQILRNLVANAIRYTSVGQVTVRCIVNTRHLLIAVEDTGIGISKHEQETIFEEFFQVNTQRGTKGMGLGLAIVQRLVRLLHIPIQLKSQPGEGSIFTITLPLASAEAGTNSHDKHKHDKSLAYTTSSLMQALIVVIEDDENILHATRTLLEQWDGRVIAATSGAEALTLCSEEIKIPDLLICDYRLNLNETGLKVVRNLREEFNHQIPAILITGDISAQLAQEARAAGLFLMHKPIQAEVLHDAVTRLINGESQG